MEFKDRGEKVNPDKIRFLRKDIDTYKRKYILTCYPSYIYLEGFLITNKIVQLDNK